MPVVTSTEIIEAMGHELCDVVDTFITEHSSSVNRDAVIEAMAWSTAYLMLQAFPALGSRELANVNASYHVRIAGMLGKLIAEREARQLGEE